MAFSLQQTVIELFAQQLGITLLCWGLVVIISTRKPKMMKRDNKTKVTALELLKYTMDMLTFRGTKVEPRGPTGTLLGLLLRVISIFNAIWVISQLVNPSCVSMSSFDINQPVTDIEIPDIQSPGVTPK